MADESQVSWLDLPHELWPLIGQCLDSYIEVLRFRSVCRLWRDSLPRMKVTFARPYRSPEPDPKNNVLEDCIFLRRIIYSFTPLNCSSKGFLAMIDSTRLNKRFKCPVYSSYEPDNNERKEVNFLDFRIHEVSRSYSLTTPLTETTDLQRKGKFVASPNQELYKNKNISIIMAFHYKKLLIMEFVQNFKCKRNKIIAAANHDDTIMYKGQVHTIDRQGRVFLVDSAMNLEQISPAMSIYSDFKHLVECEGELYVVDRFLERNVWSDSYWFGTGRWGNNVRSVDFKIHRLDEERKRWVKVDNLGNHAFVVGMNCFSVSAPDDVEGFEKNCIYFLHAVYSCFSHNHCTHVFDLQTSTISKSCAQILRARPL